MTTIAKGDTLVAANDDFTAIDHLLAAYRLTMDPFGKHLIELALIHEGQKIAQNNPDINASAAPARGLGTGN